MNFYSEGYSNETYKFQEELQQECFSYGWGRGIKKAMSLHDENLKLKKEIEDILNGKNKKYMVLKIEDKTIFEEAE